MMVSTHRVRHSQCWLGVVLTIVSHFSPPIAGAAKDESPHQFMNLRATCLSDKITISLQTQDPFEGLLYSRNFPSTCRVAGRRENPVTTLIMEPERCGIKTLDGQGRVGVREVDLYIQQDAIFQQVIDEQFLVRCLPEVEEGTVHYQSSQGPVLDSFTRDVSVTSKFVGRSRKDPPTWLRALIPTDSSLFQRRLGIVAAVQEEHGEQPFFAHLVNTNRDVSAKSPDWIDKSRSRSAEHRNARFSNPLIIRDKEPRAGWMELEWEDQDHFPQSGDNVQLVMRLKQTDNHDTMISNCVAHSGNPHDKQSRDLTDFRGCSLDKEVMSDFQASFNSRTGVKLVKAEFPIFRFPRQNNFHIKCNVLVCKKNCPVAKCQDSTFNYEPQEEFTKVSIIDKFMLETHTKVQGAPAQTTREDSIIQTFIRVEEPQKAIPANEVDPIPIIKSVQHPDRLTQEEVEDVQEVRVEKELLAMEEGVEVEEESLLCLSPARLALAFALLLVVLFLALVFACVLWWRARTFFRRPKPPPPPPPLIARPNNVAPPPHTMRRGQPVMFPARGRMPPYIRVMQ